jgi:hypothetical protein
LSATSYVLAEYASEEALYAAARRLRESGHASLDIHSPYPLNGSDQALGLKRSKVPLMCLGGGLAGVATALLIQWWMNAIDYPINVGNRLLIPYPAMIPVTFELGVLFASLSVFFGILALFGATRLHHPLFEVEAFRSAAVDALWLSVEVKPEEAQSVAEELRRLGAAQVALAPEGA